jgi:DNA-binding transcriptional regulator LsrR (DeoR family)
VWLILFRDVRDGLARAGMSDIARRAGLSRRGVVKAIDGLKKRRMIEVAVRGSVNGSTNAYRIYGTALVNRGSLPLGNPECRT